MGEPVITELRGGNYNHEGQLIFLGPALIDASQGIEMSLRFNYPANFFFFSLLFLDDDRAKEFRCELGMLISFYLSPYLFFFSFFFLQLCLLSFCLNVEIPRPLSVLFALELHPLIGLTR